MPKSVIGWAVLAIVLILIFQNPAGAGDTVHHWVSAAITFVQHL